MAKQQRRPSRETDISEPETGASSASGDVFDLERVRRFIELMNEHDVTELDLRQGGLRIRLRRGPETVAVAAGPAMASSPAPSASQAGAAEKKAAAADEATALMIRSPMVGTFYSAATPDAPPFVKVGDLIGPETTVCIIEAMKVFNEIPAECAGRIVAVLAQNGDAVEFGQPLFRVEPN